ncbi:B-cell receptor CD22-like [Labrus bergylta]|uniref:B-cell receptor CD22-like n=1 Tax=Labrus bergylta TaxID=56723 RepID=UPI003313E047
MRGAAMSLKAAVSGLVIFLLSVSVVQGQDSWRVTYSSLQICAYKGSTVEMNCTFTYPERTKGEVNSLQKTFWLRKDGFYYKDVETVSEYSGRVKNICDENKCTLRITNLRETDSTVYRFGFITNKDSYHGRPGVTLSVTDLQVKVSRPHEALLFQCLSGLSSQTSYIWFRNGHQIEHQTLYYYYPPEQLLQTDSYSCALSGHEKCPSPPVYAPKLPSVSVSPSAEIVEGSSVTLTCSSDANPAATFKWYKRNQTSKYLGEGAQLVFSSIKSSDSGEFSCKAENDLGKPTYKWISIDVKYAPQFPSVSVSPSAEIVEGSSVTLNCSSDANPAANYTWFKKNGPLNLNPSNAGAQLVLSSVNSSASGKYYCEAENTLGRRTSKHISINVKWGGKSVAVAGTITVVLLVIVFLSVLVWIRQKRASNEPSEAEERQEHTEQGQPEEQEDLQYASIHFSKTQEPLYSNTRPARPPRRTEQQDVTEYAAVKFTRNSTAMRTRSKEPEEDPAALYSTVNKSR